MIKPGSHIDSVAEQKYSIYHHFATHQEDRKRITTKRVKYGMIYLYRVKSANWSISIKQCIPYDTRGDFSDSCCITSSSLSMIKNLLVFHFLAAVRYLE